MSDASDLIGHAFTYAGAQYGMIIRQMIKAGSWRSILFFDEVDKVSRKHETHEIYNALIHLTDPSSNDQFQDRFYATVDFDLSSVLIVFSYNDSSKLDPILRDRIKEIHTDPYGIEDKINIAQEFLLKELFKEIGLNPETIKIERSVIAKIIENYTQEAGVRSLKRKLEQILLKLNIDRIYQTSYGLSEHIDITWDVCVHYLGETEIKFDTIHKEPVVGIMNGLYATSSGLGGIVPIQIKKNFLEYDTIRSRLKITGNQKKVMKESIICAYNVAMDFVHPDKAKEIDIAFPHGFHIHTPDGGTPKDGPSAGAAFTLAFISVFLNKPINNTIAITGEIDLTGKINKIGGLVSKLTGARKAGVSTVYICDDNKSDYEKIRRSQPELFGQLKIEIVSHITDLFTEKVFIGWETDVKI